MARKYPATVYVRRDDDRTLLCDEEVDRLDDEVEVAEYVLARVARISRTTTLVESARRTKRPRKRQ